MSTSVFYGRDQLATVTNETVDLKTGGKVCEYDITLEDVTPVVYPSTTTRQVAPTEQTQVISVTPGAGYDGLSQVDVVVMPIPSDHIVPTGTVAITSNGTGVDVAQYATADVNVVADPVLKMGVIRPDATLVKTYTYDQWINSDEEVTIPAYTTTSTTLLAAAAYSETVTCDFDNYNYYVLERFLTIPKYNVATKAKGRVEYAISSHLYEVTEIPANTIIALVDGTTKYGTRATAMTGVHSVNRLVYWSSGTAITTYSSAAYGTFQTVTAPTLSSGKLTLTRPALGVRGHTTYFTSTYFNALVDIRYQSVIEVWRAPKNNLNLDGWGASQQALHIIGCANSPDRTLT